MKKRKKEKNRAKQEYNRILYLQLREKIFSKQYFDVAAKLEEKRNSGKEYVV